MRTLSIALALLSALTLAACKDEDGNEIDLVPVCHALLGPIKYNTYKVTSGRFSGATLAMDLKRRNEIWDKLHCKVVLKKG